VTDDPAPRLSWTPHAALPGLKAWRVEVERTDTSLPKISWELPPEHGPWRTLDDLALPSRARFRWQVAALTSDSAVLATPLATGEFETGLKTEADWQAKWIGLDPDLRGRSAPLFRKPFTLAKPVLRARLYVTGLGWHETLLNGHRLGDGVLEPAQTDYDRRVFYVTHDVTKLLQSGENVLGVWVGDGWYNQDLVWGPHGLSYGEPRLIAQLEVTHPDNSVTTIISDETWRASPSAVTTTNIYQGENFDARLYDPAWSTPGFDAASWSQVTILPAPGGRLVAAEIQPCRVMRSLPVATWAEPSPGVHVANFGQNLTGWTRLRVHATKGTKITLRFAESLLPDGNIDPTSTGVVHTKQVQTDTYISHGRGEEIWEPRFTFHVFQYVEVVVGDGELLSPLVRPATLTGLAVYTDLPVRGEFACSDPVIQRMSELADWTVVGNMQGLPSDCPGRERCGWTGDAHLLTPYVLHRYDSAAMWGKYYGDILTSAERAENMLTFGTNFGERKVTFKPAGLPTMIAPGLRSSGAASPDWGSAIVFIPWDIYRLTGDDRILRRHYASFVQWVEHLRAQSVNHIVRSGLGDWCTPWRADGARPDEPHEYYGRIVPELSTACYWRSTQLLAEIARVLGHHDHARRYGRLADDIAQAFMRSFYDADQHRFADQTVNAIAIGWGLLEDEQSSKVAAALAQQIADDGDHFYTGVFGLTSLFQALGNHGHDTTISRIFANPHPPGFRYLLAQGATTNWEVLPSRSDEGQIYERSKSHPFQSAWASWCYEGIGGIQPDDRAAGFRHFRLAPQMTGKLAWARVRQVTAMGPIESSWRRNNDSITVVWTPGTITAITSVKSSPPAVSAHPILSAGRYEVTFDLPR